MASAAKPRMSVTWWTTAHYSLIVLVVPSLLLFVAGKILGASDPVANLDLLIIYIFGILLERFRAGVGFFVSIVGISFVIIVQLLMNVGLIYIDDPALIAEYIQFARYWPWGLIAFSALPLIASICILGMALRRIPIAAARVWPVAALLLALVIVELIGRTGAGFAVIKANPTTSSAVRSFKMLRTWVNSPGFMYAMHPGQSMSSDLADGQPPPARILSISVEALGLSNDAAFNSAVMAPLEVNLRHQYSIEFGVHEYKGATLAGELRELCGLRISGTPTRAASQSISPFCLPKRLGDIGYSTTALHGNSRFFYNRQEMYKAIGFKKSEFYEDMTARGARICRTRSFSGVCDDAVLNAALEALGAADKSFVHVMTLETHFPLSSRSGDIACEDGGGGKDRNLCIYKDQFAHLMELIATSLARAQSKPDVVYIYGDHAPPYVLESERSYFDRQRVPFVVLKRRQDPIDSQ